MTHDIKPLKVAVLLFDGAEELDAMGPYETLRMWQHLGDRAVDVRAVSLDGGPVACSLGITMTPHGAVDDDRPDLLIHPGGAGVIPLLSDETHLDRLRRLREQGTVLASVCNGATVFAAAGILDGLPVTSHWGVLDALASQFPSVDVQGEKRWIDTGQVVTSSGVTAGIDLGLHLVDRFENTKTARSVAGMLDHPWDPDDSVRNTDHPENIELALAAAARMA